MSGIILLTVAITISVIAVMGVFLHHLSRFKERTIDEVREFVCPLKALATEDEYSEHALRDLRTMRKKGRKFCQLVQVLRVKIWCWRVLMAVDRFRLLPTPNLSNYRRVGFVDMIELYQDIKLAAAGFALTYDEGESQLLLSRL